MDASTIFRCTKCGEEKTGEDFPHAKGRRHSWCRVCLSQAKKEYRRKRRETVPRKKRIASDYLTDDGKIICPKCGVAQEKDQYQSGRVNWCRTCRRERQRLDRREAGVAEKKFSIILEGDKKCTHCGEMKPITMFSPAKRGRGGVGSYCKPCAVARVDRVAVREKTRAYRERHRERARAAHRVRMFEYRTARKVTSDGSVTDALLKALYASEECHYCGEQTPREFRTVDHRTPLARGGGHTADNLVMACRTCNCSKRDKTEAEYRGDNK